MIDFLQIAGAGLSMFSGVLLLTSLIGRSLLRSGRIPADLTWSDEWPIKGTTPMPWIAWRLRRFLLAAFVIGLGMLAVGTLLSSTS